MQSAQLLVQTEDFGRKPSLSNKWYAKVSFAAPALCFDSQSTDSRQIAEKIGVPGPVAA